MPSLSIFSRIVQSRVPNWRPSSRTGPETERAWAISHMLRYAQWDDIWLYVTRDQVRQIFPSLELPETLRQAWARMLKIEAPVTT